MSEREGGGGEARGMDEVEVWMGSTFRAIPEFPLPEFPNSWIDTAYFVFPRGEKRDRGRPGKTPVTPDRRTYRPDAGRWRGPGRGLNSRLAGRWPDWLGGDQRCCVVGTERAGLGGARCDTLTMPPTSYRRCRIRHAPPWPLPSIIISSPPRIEPCQERKGGSPVFLR